jgi:integrase
LAEGPVEEISRRVLHLQEADVVDDPEIVGAVLGGAEPPRGLMLSGAAAEALRLKAPEAKDKGRNQRRLWENAVKRSFARFAELVGDKPVDELTREDARAFRAHWSERISREGLSAASANREIAAISGALRSLNLLAGVGDPDIFHRLRFSAPKGGTSGGRPPCDRDYIVEAIYAPGALDGLNKEARAILELLINTGMRPSEVVGLDAAAIRLEAPVPHVSIAPRPGREIKTQTSIRDIPLVGRALQAMRRFPEGFSRYADREPSLCQTLNKHLKSHGLKPSPKHCVYSFRHGFQDRLIAVEAPDRIQADLMGHRYVRERYGKGPDLAQKAVWLQRVALAPAAS